MALKKKTQTEDFHMQPTAPAFTPQQPQGGNPNDPNFPNMQGGMDSTFGGFYNQYGMGGFPPMGNFGGMGQFGGVNQFQGMDQFPPMSGGQGGQSGQYGNTNFGGGGFNQFGGNGQFGQGGQGLNQIGSGGNNPQNEWDNPPQQNYNQNSQSKKSNSNAPMMNDWQDEMKQNSQSYEPAPEPYVAPKPAPKKEEPAPQGNKKNQNQKGGKNQKNQKNEPKQDKKAPKKVVEKPKKKEEVIDVDKIREGKKHTLDWTKDPMNLIIIGHVDSGKSTLAGNMLIHTGQIEQEELRRYEAEAKANDRESWMFAYVMDINEEEKEKGKTVEVGKASFETADKRFIILDCPGHRQYVPNMIAGATQADVAALVVSAKSGEFEAGFERGGQTMEHTILARYLGSEYLVIIVNKMDDCNWDKKRFDMIKEKLTPFLRDTCQWDLEKQVKWVPVTGLGGDNISQKVSSDLCPWYEGECLLEEFNSLPKIERPNMNVLRIPIFDKYKDKGDVSLFGKVVTGAIKENMSVTVMPKGQEITITKIYDNNDEQIALAEAGDNIKVGVKGISDIEDIKRGNMICGVQYKCFVCYEFMAEIKVMELPDKKKIISDGFPAVMHMHCIQEEVSIKKIRRSLDDPNKKGKIFLKAGERGEVMITCPVPLCLEKYDEFPALARFTLRSESWTIAVGKVLKVKPIDMKDIAHQSYFLNMKEKGDAPK